MTGVAWQSESCSAQSLALSQERLSLSLLRRALSRLRSQLFGELASLRTPLAFTSRSPRHRLESSLPVDWPSISWAVRADMARAAWELLEDRRKAGYPDE